LKESIPQKQIKSRLAKLADRSREYYWVKDFNDEVYHGEPYNPLSSPKGHKRAEENAKSWSEEINIKVEVYWTTGLHGMKLMNQLKNWRLFKI
jgi:hypothetical protein